MYKNNVFFIKSRIGLYKHTTFAGIKKNHYLVHNPVRFMIAPPFVSYSLLISVFNRPTRFIRKPYKLLLFLRACTCVNPISIKHFTMANPNRSKWEAGNLFLSLWIFTRSYSPLMCFCISVSVYCYRTWEILK